ncbi:MAG: hypothetical protein CMF69_10860 [Magnetovibrio sp.]|nr:hypothetical protein [Magnetovibrio sp.]|tara:strand:- start:287 stop:544 length:258 start_codon:yes stop_codon:yes gene_type:complete
MKEKNEKSSNVKTSNGSVSKNASKEIKKEKTKQTSSPKEASSNAGDGKVEKSKNTNSEKATYVRGESQKPVTESYRRNWNAIFKR